MKPLYKFQQQITYKKHIQRLKQIKSPLPGHQRLLSEQTISNDDRPWVRQNFSRRQTKQHQKIQNENQKLLDKLLQISNKNSGQFSVGDQIIDKNNNSKSNSLQPNTGFQHRQSQQQKQRVMLTPFRKNWLKSIKIQNQQFGQKLMNLRSSLQYTRQGRSIQQYQKLKRSMKINRRAKLPMLPKSKQKSIDSLLERDLRLQTEEQD